MIQQNSSATAQMSAASEDLSEQAEQLLATAAFFKLTDEFTGRAPRGQPSRAGRSRLAGARVQAQAKSLPATRTAGGAQRASVKAQHQPASGRGGVKLQLDDAADDVDDSEFERN